MTLSIADIRRDYRLQSLNEEDVAVNPVDQFTRWWEEAVSSHIDEVNAMTLATVDTNGFPAARIVLLKGFDEKGFVFYTNYNSHKGQELEKNPHVALVFFWKELERQVRITGSVTRTSAADSDAYFHSRPAGSRIGAWASPQSTVIANREIIETSYCKYEQEFGYEDIPRPDYWGGYLVKPLSIEFWQGRGSRLHDRILYTPSTGSGWKKERLAP